MDYKQFLAPAEKTISLADFDPDFTGNYKNKETALADLQHERERIADLQDVMYAQNTQSLVVIFQAMDAAGKDSAIKHVFRDVDPQGITVAAFKAPSEDELDHDYLWRVSKHLPERGKIGVFSRSYYEDVLVVRVHPQILQSAPLPEKVKNDEKIWEQRFEDIRNFELYLHRNGVHVLKFFLLTSKEEQKKQLMERIEDPEKHWKFRLGDLKDRAHWDDFMRAYEAVFAATSTEIAPWYIIPGNKRWFTRAVVARIVADKLNSMDLKYPLVSQKQKQEIEEARRILESE